MPPRKKAKTKPRARRKVKETVVVISRPRTIACFRRRAVEGASNPEPSTAEVEKQEDRDKENGIEDEEQEEEEDLIQTSLYLTLRLPPHLLSTLSPPPLPNLTIQPPPPQPLTLPTPHSQIFTDETSPIPIPPSSTPSSVSLDKTAIFPPGIPMSAAEILAFYPQHISWPAVFHRLSRNGYTTQDIRDLGGIFRSEGLPEELLSVWNIINNQSGEKKKKKGVKHLGTQGWVNPLGEEGSVPSFEQLMDGVKRMPRGVGARHLTSVLEWYLSVRDTFTPRLELNVLHTRSLVLALRNPVRRYGPQNVDAAILSFYRQSGGDGISSALPTPRPLSPNSKGDAKERSRIKLNVARQTVEVKVCLRVGSVLLMGYFGVGVLVCRALEWGVGRLERKGEGGGYSGGDENGMGYDEVVQGGGLDAGGMLRGCVGSVKRKRDEDDEGQEEREGRVSDAPRG